MMKQAGLKALAFAGALLAAGQANAADYEFFATYSGGGVIALDPGSTDPVGLSLLAGDSFTYTISADGAGAWKALTDGGVFPILAFPISESAHRTVDFTLDLLNNGSNVFSYGETGVFEGYVHLGTNTVNLTPGLIFDQWVLKVDLISAFEGDQNNPPGAETTSTPTSLLPIFGTADQNEPTVVTYSATGFVPEPGTWGLMLLGFGGLGAMLRRRRAGLAAA